MPEICPTLIEAEFISLPVNRPEVWISGFLGDLEASSDGLRLKAELGFPVGRIESKGWPGVAALDIDRCGMLFILDTAGRLWFHDPYEDSAEPVPCLPGFTDPSGLALSDRTVFVAQPKRITALARMNWQIRWIWDEREGNLGDVVCMDDETLFVLDREQAEIKVFGPAGNLTRTIVPENLVEPLRMARGQDGMFYLLDSDQVIRFDSKGIEMERMALSSLTARGVEPVSVTADASGTVFIGDGHAIQGEEARVIHRISIAGDGALQNDPLPGFQGAALQMAWGKGRRLYIVEEGDKILFLSPLIHYRRNGSFFLPLLDSGSEETRWHKVVLDADRPDGTEIRVQYLISNKYENVEQLRNLPASHWSDALVNFADVLLPDENPVGRYLALRGELATNNPLQSPNLRSVTAVFPRQSYLRYLPPFFQEDSDSRELLERFLAIFETLVHRVDETIDDTPRLIDPTATPREFLPWLSHWVALSLEEGWSETQKRWFLQNAMTLYRERGTRSGISRTVEMLTGNPPLIMEPFQLDCIEDPEVRKAYERVYGSGDCHFCVLVSLPSRAQADALTLVRRSVEEQTPAHVSPSVSVLRPWFHLGMPTYLGINTLLSEPVIRLEKSVLAGGETALTDVDEAGQMERKTRVGMDTTLR